MLGRRIDPAERIHVQTLTRRYPDDPPLSSLDHLLGDALSKKQRANDVDLEFVPHVRAGNVEDRSTFQSAGVVHQDLDIPAQGLPTVALVGDIELLDRELYATRYGLALQGLDLSVDLDRRDDIEALFGKPHRRFATEAGTGPNDQHSLHEYPLKLFR